MRINFTDLQAKLDALNKQASAPDLWSDSATAQSVLREQAALEKRLAPWQQVNQLLHDVHELIALGDDTIQTDLEDQLVLVQTQFTTLKEELKYAGQYDAYDVIMSIHAGAGGTDAQDWAAMLQRMYTRWSEQNNYSISLVDISSGEEAGIKSCTLIISGQFAYGRLKGEHGVHRLVRQSPFNADSLRQTSFAKQSQLTEYNFCFMTTAHWYGVFYPVHLENIPAYYFRKLLLHRQ
jgi:peptide chain release factor 2